MPGLKPTLTVFVSWTRSMKVLLAVLVSVGVVGRVWAQDGSFVLDSRGVHLEQGLTPSTELMQNHQAFSQDFKLRSQESATAYSLGDVSFNDPIPDYSWAYEVDARSTGDRKSAREERRGDVVVGQYSVHDPDGSLRVVDYSVAPGTGFQASVSKEYDDDGFQEQYRQESRNQFQSQQYSGNQYQSQQNRGKQLLNQRNENSRFQGDRGSRDQFQSQFNHGDRYNDQLNTRREFQSERDNRNQFRNQESYRNEFQNQQSSRDQFFNQQSDRIQSQQGARSQNQNSNRFQTQNQQDNRFQLQNQRDNRFQLQNQQADRFQLRDQQADRFQLQGQRDNRFQLQNQQAGRDQFQGQQGDRFQLLGQQSERFQTQDRQNNRNEFQNPEFNRDHQNQHSTVPGSGVILKSSAGSHDYQRYGSTRDQVNDQFSAQEYQHTRRYGTGANQYNQNQFDRFSSRDLSRNQNNYQGQSFQFSRSSQGRYDDRNTARFYNEEEGNAHNQDYSPVSVVLAGQ